jgi:hypothetical protein
MPRLRKPLEVLELSGVFRPDRHGQRCAAPKSERSIGAPPACLAPDEAAAWCEFVGYCQLRPSKTWGVGRLSTPPGETPMQREAGATSVAVTSRFRSPPPRFWTVSGRLPEQCNGIREQQGTRLKHDQERDHGEGQGGY